MSSEKRAPGGFGDLLGMKNYPVIWEMMGIIINHYKDPY